MCNEDESVWITYNGEFYNFQDFKPDLIEKGYLFKSNSDTEVIIHLYQEYGISETLRKINGMFAFALWDSRVGKMFICRDRLGIKPLFYSQSSQSLIFASEMKAILASGKVSREINKQAIYDYFSLKTVPSPSTAFKDIQKLKPGHYITIQNQDIEIKEYWDLDVKKFHSDTEADTAKEVNQRFHDAVQRRMISDVPIGAFLSGGVDSSGVVAMMAKSSERLSTYSIGLSEYAKYDETTYAKLVSDRYSTDHKVFDLQSNLFTSFKECVAFFDEPFAIASSFALFFLSGLTKKDVSVVLSGDGGDEIFAGYSTKYGRDELLNKLKWIPKTIPKIGVSVINRYLQFTNKKASKVMRLRKFLNYLALSPDQAYYDSISVYNEADKRFLFSEKFLEGSQLKSISHVFEEYYKKHDFQDNLQRRLYGEIKTRLQDEMLTKVDRMAMSSGLEARTPILDHELVNYAININSKFKLHDRHNGKMIFKKALEKELPSDILYRKKSGFSIPIDHWFQNQLSDFVDEILSEKELNKHGFFNIDYVNRLKDLQKKGASLGTKDTLHNHIFLLVVFQIWYNRHIDN